MLPRLAPLLVLAACARDWKQAPPREPEPEPDRNTIYVEPAPTPRPLATDRRVEPFGAVPCGARLNATAASIALASFNHTPYAYDLCGGADRALARLSNLAALRSGGFQIDVELREVLEVGDAVKCKVDASLRAQPPLGKASGAAIVRSVSGGVRLAADACIDAVIANLIERKIAPQMQQHVAGLPQVTPSAPTPTPTTTAPPPATP